MSVLKHSFIGEDINERRNFKKNIDFLDTIN